MSWRGGLIGTGLVIAIGVIMVGRADWGGAASELKESPAEKLSDQEKQRIRSFWTAFRAGDQAQREARWEPAVTQFRRALKFDPVHQGALYHLANCYIELEQFQPALELLARLITANPMSQRGHLQIGLIRSCPDAGAAFDLAAAERALQRAFAINPEETGSLLRLAGVALVKGERKRAIEFYQLANQSNFRAVEGYYVRAYLCFKAGELEAARRLLGQALEQSKAPKLVAGVAAEGDTRPGAQMSNSTIDQKRLVRPFWNGLVGRFPDGEVKADALDREFQALQRSLDALTKRSRRRP